MGTLFYILLTSVILCLVFFIKQVYCVSGKSTPFKIFICFNLLLGLILTGLYIYTIDLAEDNIFVNFYTLLFFVLCLCLSPTWYLYVKALTESISSDGYVIEKAKHFYPAGFLAAINIFAFVYLTIKNSDSSFYTYVQNVMEYANLIAIYFVFLFQVVMYVFMSIDSYRKHSQNIRELYSFQEGINLNWILNSILGFIIFIATIYLVQIGIPNGDLILSITIIVYVLFININALKQESINAKIKMGENHSILATRGVNNKEFSNTVKENNLHLKSEDDEKSENDIEENWIAELAESITNAMVKDKIYLDKDLSLFVLSNHLNSNTKYVSHTINTKFNKNFSSFVNEYRINEAVEILADPESEKYTLEHIAQKAGFKSRSSFISAFKKVKNMTPSRYKAKIIR